MSNAVTSNLTKLDAMLKNVSYKNLNSPSFKPSPFALKYWYYMDMVNKGSGTSENKTPPFHFNMLNKLDGSNTSDTRITRIANLNFRGSAKTTLFGDFMFPYLAIFNSLPVLDNITGMIFVGDSLTNGVKNLRKNLEFRYLNSPFLQQYLPEVNFTDERIDFKNINNRMSALRMFGASSGVRGVRLLARRPQFLLLDDILDQEYVDSPTYMDRLFGSVYEGAMPMLDPLGHVAVFNGTPMRGHDIIVSAITSGGWDSNVYPICEKFPCTREEFVGAWPERFSYDYMMSQYKLAASMGKSASFFQEYMLQISSEDARLVKDDEIKWYSKTELLDNSKIFNFYITTDFATSVKEHADFSVISVWAHDPDGNWFLVDGYCGKSLLDVTIDKLFQFVHKYKPMSVGIEVTGQQGGFIPLIQREMRNKGIYFNLASATNNTNPGIRPTKDKMTRFKLALPLITLGQVYFPTEMQESSFIKEFIQELTYATDTGFRGKDDCIDTFSMLPLLNAFPPSKYQGAPQPTFRDNSGNQLWGWKKKPFKVESNFDSYLG